MSDPVRNPKFIDLKDFASVRKKVELQLRAPQGKRFFRSLDELSNTQDFRELMHREFPQAASEWDDGFSRRNFMKLMGASLALAGLTSACAPKPEEKIVPYVQQPEILVPGKPLFYASTMPWGGFGKGVLVEQHEGRPTKIEGNPDHPASQAGKGRGGSDIWAQASVLTLYDPDRSQVITRYGNISSWGTFIGTLTDALAYEDWSGSKTKPRTKPAHIRLLTESSTSPSFKAQVEAVKTSLGGSLNWHTYDAIGRDNIRAGAKAAFGEDLTPVYNFAAATTVVSLDCNFLTEEPGSIRYAADYMSARRVRALGENARLKPGNRLYAIESVPTIVGAMADHKLRVKPSDVHAFAAALYAAVSSGKSEGATFPKAEKWFGLLVKELLETKGKSLVIAGEYAPVEVHILAHAINAALGNIAAPDGEAAATRPTTAPSTEPATKPAGEEKPTTAPAAEAQGKPVMLVASIEANPVNGAESIKALTAAIKTGDLDVLLILGGNPVYNAPAELDFAGVLKGIYDTPTNKGKFFMAHMGLYEDETARLCEWHLPEAHWLEAWGDIRAYDGTASIIQPLIAPLYTACRSQPELLATLLERVLSGGGKPSDSPVAGTTAVHEVLRNFWRAWFKESSPAADFEAFWTNSLRAGVLANTTLAAKAVSFKGDAAKASIVKPMPGLTLMLRPDPNVWDGGLANNGWLQETPRPLTKLTWDNALLLSPRAAVALSKTSDFKLTDSETGNVMSSHYTAANGKTVDITIGGRTLTGVPVWIVPGHPDECATLYLGYGRKFAGHVGSPDEGQVGFDAYTLRSGENRWNISAAELKVTGNKYPLAVTQNQQVINRELNTERELVIAGYSVNEVAEEYAKENEYKTGQVPVPAEGGEATPESKEYKYDAVKNLTLARRVGLPILPDDPDNSSAGLFPEEPDQAAGQPRDNTYAAWGMVIDQTACIGCQACVVACQAENNIPIVGKEQVINERAMPWLRIDTYYVAEPVDPKSDPDGSGGEVDIVDPKHTYFQPLPCMQCEKAPCELVCPVGATVHSKEGLNDMAYNRCVGTRYCSNNCPYKVRRFNFLKYADDSTPVLKLLRNPDVTVRSRGVMEKCTYCVQRISRGRIEAKKAEVALLAEGASPEVGMEKFNSVLDKIQTACQQSCPTNAIIFGNMADAKSEVYKLKREPVGFHYGLLAELNTRPRTTYLARIENPRPETIVKEAEAAK